MATLLTESAGAAYTTSTTNTVTSGSFTPTAGNLLVAIASVGNGNNATITGLTLTDSVSGTWTKLTSATVSTGPAAGIWVKDAGSSPSAQTVTFTATSSGSPNNCGIVVRQFAGAAPAAQQNGVTLNTGTSATTATTESVTPRITGSQVVGAYGYSTAGRTMTANGSTTIYGQQNVGACVSAEFEANALSVAGTAITTGFTASTGGSNVFALAEIVPAFGSLFSQATPTGTITAGTGNNGTNGLHFTVKALCTLAGVWHWSSSSDTQLPTSIGVYTTQSNPSSGTLVTSNTATWLTGPGGSSASAGSGWCYAAFTSPPSLTPGVDYMATQFRNDATNRWFSFYTVTWPVNPNLLTAPMDKSTSALSQGWYNIGTSMAMPLTQTSTAGSNFGMDVQLTTTAPVAIYDQPATGVASASVSTVTFTWPVPPTPGSTVLIALSATDFGVSTAVDNGVSATTFTADLALAPGAISGKYILRGNNVTLPATGSYHVTVTFGGTNNFVSGAGASFLGLASGAAASTTSNSGTSSSVTTGNLTPAATGDLLWGGFTDDSSGNPETITMTTTGAGTVYTNTNGATLFIGSWAYKPVTTTSAQGFAWTLGDAPDWGGYISIYNTASTSHAGATALTGSGTLTAAGVLAGAASLSGSGTITATGQKTVPGAVAASGTGNFSATGQKTVPGALAMTGSGTLTAAGVLAGSASMSGSGTITAAGQKTVPGASAMSGSGTFTAAGVLAGAASLSGSGTITATGQKNVPGAVALSGSGTFTAAGAFGGAASLSGSGTITATGQKSVPGATAMSGTGTFTAAGVLAGSASLSGSGTITATGQKNVPGAAALSGTGTFTAAGQKTAPGAVAASGTGTFTATGQKTVPGALAASGTGTLTATGQKNVPGAAALSGSGTITPDGQKTVPGAAAMDGEGTLTAPPTHIVPGGTASMSGSGTFTATGQKLVPGAAALDGEGNFTAVEGGFVSGAAALSGSGTIIPGGQKLVPGASSMNGAGTLTAAGTATYTSPVPMSGSGSITATGQKNVPGAAALSGSGTISPDGQKNVPGAVSLAGSGSLAAANFIIFGGFAALSGSGTITPDGQKKVPGAVSLSGSGSLTATWVFTRHYHAGMSGSGSMTAAPTGFVSAAAALGGSGTLSSQGTHTTRALAHLAAAAGLTSLAVIARPGTGHLAAPGSLVVTAVISRTGSAHLTADPVLYATAFTRFGTASFAGQAVLLVAASAGPDLNALWTAYQQAVLLSQSLWSTYRMTRPASTTDGTAGFMYAKAYEADRAADAAYAAWQAAQRRVRPGVTG